MPHARPGKEWLHLRDAICLGDVDAIIDQLTQEGMRDRDGEAYAYQDMKDILSSAKLKVGWDACAVVDKDTFQESINYLVTQTINLYQPPDLEIKSYRESMEKSRWDRVFNDMVGRASGRIAAGPAKIVGITQAGMDYWDEDPQRRRTQLADPIRSGSTDESKELWLLGQMYGAAPEDTDELPPVFNQRYGRLIDSLIAKGYLREFPKGSDPSHYTKDTPQGALEGMEERLSNEGQFERRMTRQMVDNALNELNIKMSELQGAILDLATQTVPAPVVQQIQQAAEAIEEAAVQVTRGGGPAPSPQTAAIREYALSLGQDLANKDSTDIMEAMRAQFPDITRPNVLQSLNAAWRKANNLPNLRRAARPTSAPPTPPTGIPVEPMEGGEIEDLLGGLGPVRHWEQPERMTQSYQVLVIIRPGPDWIANKQRFATYEEAQEYRDRWVVHIPDLEDSMIAASEDPPNMVDGHWVRE